MITVAVVEDIEEIREAITAIIKDDDGLSCTSIFSNAEDALLVLSKKPVDVVLIDIHLPVMNGIDCMRQLKEVHPKMLFIMSTIYMDDDNIFNALKAGASGYLLKGDERQKIISALFEVYNGGSPMSAQIARRVIETFQQSPAQNLQKIDLTKRENELLVYLAKGYRYKEIADQLFINIETVRKHINNIYSKLHVQSRMEAVNKVFGPKI